MSLLLLLVVVSYGCFLLGLLLAGILAASRDARGCPRHGRVTDEATTRMVLYPSRRQALLSGAVGLTPRWRAEDHRDGGR